MKINNKKNYDNINNSILVRSKAALVL